MQHPVNVLLCERRPALRQAVIEAVRQVDNRLSPHPFHIEVVPPELLEERTRRPIFDLIFLDVGLPADLLAYADRQVWARLFFIGRPDQIDQLEQLLHHSKGNYIIVDGAGRWLELLQMELRLMARHCRQRQVPLSKREQRFAAALRAGETGFFELATDLSRGFLGPNCDHTIAGTAEDLPEIRFFWLWFRRRVHPQDSRRLVKQLRALLHGEVTKMEAEVRFAMPNGNFHWLAVSTQTVTADQQGRSLAVAGTIKNISARKAIEAENFRRANYDSLTNLPNRVLFFDRLKQATKAVTRRGGKLAVLFIDLNRFKWINDFLGHGCGDKLLQIAARRFEDCLRDSDTVARLGGDEFIAILNDLIDREGAERVAEKILKRLAQPFNLDGEEVSISGSIGISIFPDDSLNPESLLQLADTAMYEAKDISENTYRFYHPAMSRNAGRRLGLERDLHQALALGQFRIFYQPLIDPETGRIVAAEALLRWQHPQHGLLLPKDFLDLAESSGLISPIGLWVAREACREVAAWRDRGLPRLGLNINLSSRQCLDEQFCEHLEHILAETHFPAEDLALEISAACIHNSRHHQSFFKRIAGLKVNLVVDNFGGSASPLDWLTQYPVNSVKLDRSFLAQYPNDQNISRVCRALSELAHKLDINVVGEGVENVDDLGFFSSCECNLVQGFFFAEPLPAPGFIHLAEQHGWEPADLRHRAPKASS